MSYLSSFIRLTWLCFGASPVFVAVTEREIRVCTHRRTVPRPYCTTITSRSVLFWLVRLRSQLDRNPHFLWVTMTKCNLIPRFAVYPHDLLQTLLVEPGNELVCKPNLGHVVMHPLLAACCFENRNCKQHRNQDRCLSIRLML